MLDRITRATIASRIAVTGFMTNMTEKMKSDSGQGSVEYVGIIVVVVAIIAIVAGFATDIGQSIVTQLKDGIQNIGKP